MKNALTHVATEKQNSKKETEKYQAARCDSYLKLYLKKLKEKQMKDNEGRD